ncbi:MAG TPA: LysR family transcriptional regulator [Methylomirabilota bacterium]|nr:LysR family transcriptional regulator [Methylomirabilota bacterium]
MNLGLNQLRVFEAITRSGSFIKAAERLHVTPPAVTLQVHQLEESCGARLFERIGRRVRLTPVGELLQHYATRIFALVADAEGALEAHRDFEHARLRIVTAATAAAYYLPPLWGAIARRYPGLHVQVSVENSQRVRERVLALEDDLGVIGGDAIHPDLVAVPLMRDPLVVIVARDHPWARREVIRVAALQGEKLILREPGSASRALIEERLRAHGVSCEPALEIASNEVIKRAVEMGAGIAIMSRAVVRRDVQAGYLWALRLREPGFSRTLHLAYHRMRADSPLIRAVVEISGGTRR